MDHRMLNIPDVWVEYWQRFIDSLEDANVRISDNHDDLIWAMDPMADIPPKQVAHTQWQLDTLAIFLGGGVTYGN